MKYACLIYGDETTLQKMTKEEMGKMSADSKAFHETLQKNGQFVAMHGFTGANTATTVRVRGGKTVKTDGPFAETKEQLGGYYLVEAANLDEALEIASRIPSAEFGSIEVRPIWPTPTAP